MQAKEKILLAAERLFAERGLDVSLREIAVAAGQGNHSAVQYHFDGKAGLIDALYAHRMTPLSHRRRELIDDLRARGLEEDLPALLRAYLAPLAEHVLTHGGASWYLRFTSRYVLSGAYRSWPYSGDHHPGVGELSGLLRRRLPGLTQERLRVLDLHVVVVLADLEQRLCDPAFGTARAAAAVADLRVTAHALLTA
ncbi:TetR/AcrR family transcriptional regulator [Nonomuraea sp. NPDC052265]|uniref:TetR/AcrR family transcriptional regulator n=1 Tax=Nonomuraea sp. NPDC052265 TaxID=3364374 RepID=UPI0037C7A9C0